MSGDLRELDVVSPSAAFGRQAANEAALLRSAEQVTRAFLAAVRDRAIRDGIVYPPFVANRWMDAVEELLSALPSSQQEYVRDEFLNDSLPDDVYATVTQVLATHSATFSTHSERDAAITSALDPDGFHPEQLVASLGSDAGLDAEFEALVAGYWDGIEKAGSVWIKRVRRITRTSATGLAGWITVTAIRLQDYPSKRWVTRHDDRVRHTHREADGQTVPSGVPFTVGGFPLMYPGDRAAEYGETVNCRCVLVGVK